MYVYSDCAGGTAHCIFGGGGAIFLLRIFGGIRAHNLSVYVCFLRMWFHNGAGGKTAGRTSNPCVPGIRKMRWRNPACCVKCGYVITLCARHPYCAVATAEHLCPICGATHRRV